MEKENGVLAPLNDLEHDGFWRREEIMSTTVETLYKEIVVHREHGTQ